MSADVGLVTDSPASKQHATPNRVLLAVGAGVAAIAAIAYIVALATHPRDSLLNGFDLSVYLGGAGEALHQPGRLYTWMYEGHPGIKFTYTPFAALVFAIGRAVPFTAMLGLVALVSVFSLIATIWIAFRELGWRSLVTRTGATLLVAGIVFWSQPVQRELYLGQIELGLMALVTWDLCQPDRRWWKGAATGIAAGIKLVPVLFIAYLLLTRRFKQAFVAAGAFVVSVLIGFVALPGTSAGYWFTGSFFEASRTGFVGDQENQSLRGMLTRFAGSVNAGVLPWFIAAVVVGIIGLAAGVLLHNAGHTFAGLMTCALTAVLDSPISWDHHWVWLAPGVALLIDLAVRGRSGSARGWWYAAVTAVVLLFAAWPDFWYASAGVLQGGLINYAPASSWASGDNPAYAEYHWNLAQTLAGNLYVLIGLALLIAAAVAAWRLARYRGGVPRLLRGPADLALASPES
jgi:alpha-1,2-mannosyltransferase